MIGDFIQGWRNRGAVPMKSYAEAPAITASEGQHLSCLACGACARICPQNIDIPKVLKEFDAALSGLRR
jgi:predicted aldo/keto reductase-like oxidoreductase